MELVREALPSTKRDWKIGGALAVATSVAIDLLSDGDFDIVQEATVPAATLGIVYGVTKAVDFMLYRRHQGGEAKV